MRGRREPAASVSPDGTAKCARFREEASREDLQQTSLWQEAPSTTPERLLVARYRRKNPSIASIAIHVGVLKTIMGGGTRKWKLRNGKKAAPYRVLLEEAQRMGILGEVIGAPSITAHIATVYRLP